MVDLRGAAASWPAAPADALDQRHRPDHHAARVAPRPLDGGRGARGAAHAARARSRWSGWTRRRCTPRATRRASARWCSAGSSAAGSSPRRPRPSTSSARPSSARSSPASCSPSTSTACARGGSPTPDPKGCLFEYVYLARPDTAISGRSMHAARVEMGRRLALEPPVDADLVIPVPESGTPAAIGFAEQSGIPFGQGLVKNSYVGRTFIQPSPDHPPARHPAEAQPAARGDPRASAWSSSTTRSSAATPSGPSSGCCARPARPRSTSASPRRR